jgi:hypothetical protein
LAGLEQEVRAEVQRIGDEEECCMVALGDLCEINNKNIEKYDTSYGKEHGLYKFHTGATNGQLYCDEANIKKWTIVLNKTNGSGKCNVFLDKNISCAKQTFIMQSNAYEAFTKYYYYCLCINKQDLENGYAGACHKNLSFDFLTNFRISIPKNKKLIKALEPKFEQIEQLNQEIKDHEQEYEQVHRELSEDIKKPSSGTGKQKNKQGSDSESQGDEESQGSESDEKPKKKVVKKTKDSKVKKHVSDDEEEEEPKKKVVKKSKDIKVKKDMSDDEEKEEPKKKIVKKPKDAKVKKTQKDMSDSDGEVSDEEPKKKVIKKVIKKKDADNESSAKKPTVKKTPDKVKVVKTQQKGNKNESDSDSDDPFAMSKVMKKVVAKKN